jgi:hypothetical protein
LRTRNIRIPSIRRVRIITALDYLHYQLINSLIRIPQVSRRHNAGYRTKPLRADNSAFEEVPVFLPHILGNCGVQPCVGIDEPPEGLDRSRRIHQIL